MVPIMRKLYRPFCFIAAVAAMSLTSCQKESFTPGTEEGTVITVHATVEDVANATKTHIDGTQVYWDQEEQMKVVSFDDANAASNSLTEGFTPSADYTTATFTVNINTEGKTMIAGVYPASAAVEPNEYANRYKMFLPASQQATADSYDPAAYIMITKAESLPLQNNEWNASYIRAAALTRMEVSGLNDDIKSVTVTFPEGQNASGRRYFDLATGTAGEIYTDGTNKITISYSEPLAAGTTKNVWFTSWNVDVAQGETVTVKIMSDTKIYTKTFTATKAISLKENFLNIMPIDMTGATEEDASDFSGEYLIVASSGTWHYMTNEVSSKNEYFIASDSRINDNGFSSLTSVDFAAVPDIENHIWTIKSIEGGYTIENTKGEYLSLGTGKTSANYSATPVALSINKEDNGSFIIRLASSATGAYLRFNSSADPKRFTNYISGQNDVYLLPWIISTEPILTVSQPEQTVVAEAESVSFTYVAKNITGAITAVEGTDDSNIITAVSVDEASSTVNVTLTPNTEEVEKTATITLSAEGVEPVTLTIIQKAYVATGTETQATFEFANMGLENAEEIVNLTQNDITISGALGSNTNKLTPKYYTSDKTLRMYVGNTLTISGGTIKSISFVFERGGNLLSSNVGSYTNEVWTGENDSIVFTSSGSLRIEKIIVTYIK